MIERFHNEGYFLKYLRFKKGEERRFLRGHPWVFSNELQPSAVPLEPGERVGLSLSGGEKVAWGYVNSQSLITFRALSRGTAAPEDLNLFLEHRFRRAYENKKQLGLTQSSFRWIHGEGDGIPGLTLDMYRVPEGWVGIAQSYTAGVDQLFKDGLSEVLTKLWSSLGVGNWLAFGVHRDAAIRAREGLALEPIEWVIEPKTPSVWQGPIEVRGLQPMKFFVDFKAGQKSGFFLDQVDNVSLALKWAEKMSRPEKVLDLFTYAGQWGAQFARRFECDVTGVDASASALQVAEQNFKAVTQRSHIEKVDLLTEAAWSRFEDRSFNVVICDPPALIPSRKAIQPGTKAYRKLFRSAITKVARDGMLVASSCSQLLSQEEFRALLGEVLESSGRSLKLAIQGHQSLDHTVDFRFPEGEYLKLWILMLE